MKKEERERHRKNDENFRMKMKVNRWDAFKWVEVRVVEQTSRDDIVKVVEMTQRQNGQIRFRS